MLNSTDGGKALHTQVDSASYGIATQHQAVLAQGQRIEPPVPVRTAQPEDLHAIQAVDQRGSGMDRNGLLNALFGVADTVVVERDGEVAGYGCVEEYHEVENILGFA